MTLVVVLAISAAIGGFLFGYDTSTMNSAINGIRPDLGLNSFEDGAVTALSLLACAVGAWFSGSITERWGRPRTMTVSGAAILVGSLGFLFFNVFGLLCLFRIFTGIGIGLASATVPSYISEIAPQRIRGTLGTFWQVALIFGQFLGLLVGYVFTSLAGNEAASLWGVSAWHWMYLVVAAVGLLYLLVSLRLPKSPSDAMRLGDTDAARNILRKIDEAEADQRLSALEKAHEKNKGRHASLKDLRGSTMGLKSIVWIGILLAAFQNLVGINVVKTYSNTIWESVGISADKSFFVSLLTVFISLLATVVALIIMDKVGRRTLLICGGCVMLLSMVALVFAFMQSTGGSHPTLPGGAGIVALIGMNLFAFSYGMTWGPIMWLMLSELFSSDIRSVAVSVCTAVKWTMNFLITFTFPVLAEMGLSLAYTVYAVLCAAALVFAWKKIPETRGKALS